MSAMASAPQTTVMTARRWIDDKSSSDDDRARPSKVP